jgi:hypothetical protein
VYLYEGICRTINIASKLQARKEALAQTGGSCSNRPHFTRMWTEYMWSRKGQVAGYCEYGTKILGYMEGEAFRHKLSS